MREEDYVEEGCVKKERQIPPLKLTTFMRRVGGGRLQYSDFKRSSKAKRTKRPE